MLAVKQATIPVYNDCIYECSGLCMKRLLGIILFIGLIMYTSGQDAVTESVLALVNSARNRVQIPSLQLSMELTSAAQRHSDDMAKSKQLDHIGSDDSQFWERMIDAGYILTNGAENILLRTDTNAQSVFNQWWNSPPHQANMMNADYVEVGIAYAQSSDGLYYFTMVLGTRDGVTAPMLPTATPIPPTFTVPPPTLTLEPPTNTSTPLPTATFTTTPLIPPTRTLSPLITPAIITPVPTIQPILQATATPETLPDLRLIYDDNSLTLLNISGRRLNLALLSFQSNDRRLLASVWDTEFLTERLNNFSDGDCLQVWSVELSQEQDKVDKCEIRHGWVAVNNSQLFWQGVGSFLVLNNDDIIAQCQVAESVCDVRLDAEFKLETELIAPAVLDRDIRLMFNQDSFTIINITNVPVDLRGLVFQSTSASLNVEALNTEFLTSPLSGLPANDCLMVWTFDVPEQNAPTECKIRHGWIPVGDEADFWRDVSRFEVVRNNRVLAGCVVQNGFCDVNLSGNLGASSPTVVPANPITSDDNAVVLSVSDLLLIYSLDSFALVNTSGRSLDVSGLVFESDNGIFAANRWNTDFLSRPLSDFPPGDCLQIWGVNEQLEPKPADCAVRHGWVAVTTENQFWRNVSQFRVRNGAEQVATCDFRSNQCSVNLP